jgi:hypothetical protein
MWCLLGFADMQEAALHAAAGGQCIKFDDAALPAKPTLSHFNHS